MAEKFKERVVYCKADHDPIAIVTDTDGPVECKECGSEMKEIGYFERNGAEKE